MNYAGLTLLAAFSVMLPYISNAGIFDDAVSVATSGFLNKVAPNGTVTLTIEQRSLHSFMGTVPRGVDQMVHYQVFIRDNTGRVLETYGWSNDNGGSLLGKAELASIPEYDIVPRGEITLTYEDFLTAKKEFENFALQHGYALLNGGVSKYRQPNDDGNFNCQYAAYRAFEFAAKKDSAKIVRRFQWPGDGFVNLEAIESTLNSDSSPQEPPNVGGGGGLPWWWPGPGPCPHPDPDPDPDDDKDDDRNVLDSIADLLETGEELVNERQELRDERHKRHKEPPVVDPAPEPAPTPKKKTPKKETPKKTEKKTVDQPKKADTQKTPNTTPNTTGTIDFSKLESLISKQASFIRGILSSGEEASSAQHAQFNSLNKQYSAEFDRLKAQIGKVSDSAKRSEYYNKLASINSRMNSEVDPLLSQGVSRGLFILH